MRYLVLGLIALGCSKTAAIQSSAAQANSPNPDLLVLRDLDSNNMGTLVDALRAEVGSEFDLVDLPVSPATAASHVAHAVAAGEPKAVILMDNPSVALWQDYLALGPASPPPAVIVMALFLDEAVTQTPNATGISYEVPAVTAFVNLRRVVSVPVRRIGVIHRPRFAPFVEKQARLAAKEGFEVVPVVVDETPTPFAVHRALGQLRREEGVDALWVLNDNGLLQPDILVDAWIPRLRKNTLPVVVGVPTLLETPTPFGTFAVVPDHAGLGLQTAELIWELADNEWDATGVTPQLPIAVETVLHAGFSREHLGLKEDQLGTVDRVIE